MDLRSRVNRALGRTTGYQLVRSDPTRSPAASSAPPDPAPKPARAAKPPAAGKRRTGKLPSDYDEETREIWEAVQDRTMTHHTRVHFLVQAVRYIERHSVPGAIVECG